MKHRPTFELLRERRELAVLNPDNGARFTISLRDWQGLLWAVRVRPSVWSGRDWDNPFVTAHRLLSREAIEAWLGRLRLWQASRDSRRSQTAAAGR